MIVGLLRQRNKIGFATSTCSKMYSSVARLNMISFDSATRISTAAPFSCVKKPGQDVVVAKDLLATVLTVRVIILFRSMFIYFYY